MIKITFPDGSIKEFNKGITVEEVAKSIGERLAKAALAGKVNEEMVDLNYKIMHDSKLKLFTFNDEDGKKVFWHSAAHVFAHALVNLHKDVKIAIGPAIETGFHYDFYSKKPFTPDELVAIESEMQKIVDQKINIVRKEITKKEALVMFKDNKFKVELINELEGDKVTIYEQGNFVDLCKGPHVPNTSYIKAFKLTKLASAYWKGNEKNEQLQRVYGVAFLDKKDLKEYTVMQEEAEKRDHRKIGKDLNLIMVHEYAPGMPFFLPKGMAILIELTKFVREYSYDEGYKEVRTPQVFNAELWKVSGHWDHYKDNMFCMHHAEDNMDLGLKPMNCPAHMLVFKRDTHSYKELPLRIAETTTLYRNEKSGTLTGLTRVRSLSQDDTHIFLGKDQIFAEIKILLEKIKTIYKIFDLKIDEIYLSTKPEDSMGEKETWDQAEQNLKRALDDSGLKYKIDNGGGAFYGPKIDVKVKDAIGRQWQLATIQLDFQLPQRFGLEYDDADGKRKTPVVIHRAILGSMERFLGVLIEHLSGWFPLWLAPTQARIITVTDKSNDYARKVYDELRKNGIKVEFDERAESTSKKVRDAQLEKIPIVLNIGEKEETAGTVAVRTNKDGKVKFGIKVSDFIKDIKENIDKKELNYVLK